MAVIMLSVVAGYFAGLFAWYGRELAAINATGIDRNKLLDLIFDPIIHWSKSGQITEEFWKMHAHHKHLVNEYHKVTYEAHKRARFWGRDPWRLYHPDIQALVVHQFVNWYFA